MKRPGSPSSAPRRRQLATAVSALVVAFLGIATACSNQGEGERCETQNRNEDCDTSAGLICYPANQLGSNSDRCCPADRSKATHPVCKAATDISVDATPPPDTGPAPVVDSGGADTAAPADAAQGDGEADAADAADQ